MYVFGIALAAVLGIVRDDPRERQPTPAPQRVWCVHFWLVPELDYALVRTEGWSVEWGYGQRQPRTDWEGETGPCVVCRRHGMQDAWFCEESNPIWPTHDSRPGSSWCRRAEWLGQIPVAEWRAGVLGRRLETVKQRERPPGRMHELVDILEAREKAVHQ